MTFGVLFEKDALRDLKKLDRQVAVRIVKKIQEVAKRGYGFEPLSDFEYGWKIRIGDYRALCDIDFSKEIIKVHVVAPRLEVYR